MPIVEQFDSVVSSAIEVSRAPSTAAAFAQTGRLVASVQREQPDFPRLIAEAFLLGKYLVEELPDGGAARGIRAPFLPRADGGLVGREMTAFRLPPSRLTLGPEDAIRLAHHEPLVDLRLVFIADAEARGI